MIDAVTRTPFHPDDLTTAWLDEAIDCGDALMAHRASPIGTGQVGANYRIVLEWSAGTGPSSVVAKFASLDPVSRETGIQALTYEREVAFYNELRPLVDVEAPAVYVAEIRSGTADVVVLMEDLQPRSQGDQITGCGADGAELAMVQAARLHGPLWGDDRLHSMEWLHRRSQADVEETVAGVRMFHAGFEDRYADQLTSEAVAVGRELMAGLENWFGGAPAPVTVTHGDYRLDNMMFGTDPHDRPLVVVDWQTPGHGHGCSDVAYFLGAGVLPAQRREIERDMVGLYHRELVPYHGVDVSFDECWSSYRRFAYSGFLMAVGASMIVGRTARGDEMFMAMANRHAQQAIDLDSAAFL